MKKSAYATKADLKKMKKEDEKQDNKMMSKEKKSDGKKAKSKRY